MDDAATVSAGDIARLGGVSRAAVSNWRRRHPDFPRPVDGTPASPRYDLADVEKWLRRNGKASETPALERMWQRMRAEGGELGLGHVVARAGALLVWLRDGDDEPLLPGVTERADATFVELAEHVAGEYGHAEAFELLHARWVAADSRRLRPTPPDVAARMLDLAGPADLLLDPACGTGGLLVASTAPRVAGIDRAPDRALVAAARLRLGRRAASLTGADTFDADPPPADAVVCDPPFGERLDASGPWPHGTPPRGEPELAWVQRCLRAVRPGGRVVVRMPVAAASRRGGRHVRASLLRHGALREVVAAGPDADLWVLRRPAPGDPRPSTLLLSAGAGGDRHRVRVDDLLDDTVDLGPRNPARLDTDRYPARARALGELRLQPPELRAAARDVATLPLAELERAGAVQHLHATTAAPPDATLTADDVRRHRPASGPAGQARCVHAEPGDVVVADGAALVVDAPVALATGLTAYRPDPGRLDADLLAGVLADAGGSRSDQRRAMLPDLPIAEQRPLGEALRLLAGTCSDLLRAADDAAALSARAVEGLVSGRLVPTGTPVEAPGPTDPATLAGRPGRSGRTPS
ncbi:SAM-dependent methyltransferase [Pseudonocardia sulfidoxydans NBRC 16205]|uniref:SAM-dependent methyltransferase n=1 Tax=Pseudonocardia sulfidoxydans NBRC 16205 TaxID=1223511 RepID=A0A511DFR6_9PSEU|nr:N-6 DNA methylase [Pseudonocardia sulfidoxydans]GEL23636.1 SAM-dependent methyltransferase [Pseudonocardia sulfidoxydans NBRC 16205]